MCPLRFILVILSAVLAGYYAWSNARSSQEIAMVSQDLSPQTTSSSEDKQQFNFKRVKSPFLFHLILGISGYSCYFTSKA